jgi:CBS domain-containing protein
MVFGALRLLAGDGTTAVSCGLAGWFLKEAAAAASERRRVREALFGLAVRDAMVTGVATVPAHIPLSDLKRGRHLRGGYHNYPVVRGDAIVGILSTRAALALPAHERERTSVQAVMTPLDADIVVGPAEPLPDTLARMARSGIKRLLVVEDGHLQGLLSVRDVFRRVRLRGSLP